MEKHRFKFFSAGAWRLACWIFVLLCPLVIQPDRAHAETLSEERRAQLIRLDSPQRIGNLQWMSEELEVRQEASGDETKFKVILRGLYKRAEWSLLNGTALVNLGPKSDFKIEVPLSGKTSQIDLMAVGPLGEIEKESFGVLFSGWDTFKDGAKKKVPAKISNFSLGVGYSLLSYKVNPYLPLTEGVITVKANFIKVIFPPSWDVAFGGFYNAAVINASRASARIQVLGLNLRFGYVLPFIKDPWRVSLLGGEYFVTTFTKEQLGFSKLFAPQFFPTVRRLLSNGQSLHAYFKVAPLPTSTGTLNLADRELAFGLSFVHPLDNGHPLSVSFDASSLKHRVLEYDATLDETVAYDHDMTTFSFGLSYGL